MYIYIYMCIHIVDIILERMSLRIYTLYNRTQTAVP